MNMRLPLLAMALLIGVSTARADTIQATGTCLTDSTSGRDRKDLVIWIFTAMSKHPEIASLSAITPEQDQRANQRMGALLSRLIAKDCATEVAAMVREHGVASLTQPFEVLGRVAMQELMTQKDVAASLSAIDTYIDEQRIAQVLEDVTAPVPTP